MSNEEKILDLLQGMKAEISGVSARLDSLEGKFDKLEKKFDNLEGKFDKLEGRVGKLEEKFDNLEGKFDKLEGRVGKLEEKFDNLEGKVGKLEEKFDKLEAKVDQQKTELQAEIKASEGRMIALTEGHFNKGLGALADGHKLIMEQMVTKEDLEMAKEDIQTDLNLLNIIVHEHAKEIRKLKKAQ